MGLGAGDVLGAELVVEVDRGVDVLHDFGRASQEPAAPHRVAHACRSGWLDMTNIDTQPRRRFVLAPILGALAVVAAGAGLYGAVAPAGKAPSDCPADSAKLAARLAPLAKGELAALQVTSEPRRAEQFAFERDGGGKRTVADFKIGRASCRER